MQIQMTDAAAELLGRKGGAVTIDFIKPTG